MGASRDAQGRPTIVIPFAHFHPSETNTTSVCRTMVYLLERAIGMLRRHNNAPTQNKKWLSACVSVAHTFQTNALIQNVVARLNHTPASLSEQVGDTVDPPNAINMLLDYTGWSIWQTHARCVFVYEANVIMCPPPSPLTPATVSCFLVKYGENRDSHGPVQLP